MNYDDTAAIVHIFQNRIKPFLDGVKKPPGVRFPRERLTDIREPALLGEELSPFVVDWNHRLYI